MPPRRAAAAAAAAAAVASPAPPAAPAAPPAADPAPARGRKRAAAAADPATAAATPAATATADTTPPPAKRGRRAASDPAPAPAPAPAPPAPAGRGRRGAAAAPSGPAAPQPPASAPPAPAPAPAAKRGGKNADTATAAAAPAAPAPAADAAAPAAVDKRVVVMKGKAPVDTKCPVADTTHVYVNGSTVYDATLNQTDISYNVKGHNKYYIIQLLEADNGGQYYCWQRWGRVGSDGQSALKGPFSLALAQSEFESKFFDKTNNRFGEPNFVHKPGKYDLVAVDYNADDKGGDGAGGAGGDGGGAAAAAKPAPKKVESKLDPRVFSLVELISSIKQMEAAMLEMKYDTKKAPLGKLTKQQIKAGYEALKEIEVLVTAGKTSGPELVAACNRFYTRIPHDFGMNKPPLINTVQMIKAKADLLEALGEIEIAMKVLQDKTEAETVHPVDRHYHSMQCHIAPLERSTDTFKMIERYLANTHGHTHSQYRLVIEEAFVIQRELDDKRYQYNLPNQQLLWHGSRTTNFTGILSQGLRIAPPEAPVTGYMFGKGIYTADMVSKSANYCFASRSNPTGLLMLCQVALGNINEKTQADYNADKLPPGKHSTKGVGRTHPDPSETATLENGILVPLGKGVPSNRPDARSLEYNEYIVYNVNQIRIRFLLKVRFDYSR